MTDNYLFVFHERLTKINNQLTFLDLSHQQLVVKDPKSFTEQPARKDIGVVIKDISFLEESIIYHLERYLDGLSAGLHYIEQLSQETNGSIFIPLPTNISNQISFEFEAYIISFQKFIEQPTPQIIKGVLRKEISKDFPFDDIDQKNIDGLYWRISILRNRSVHPDKPKYLTKNDEAYQYMGLSSRCLAAEVDGEDIKIKCTLFDLAENKWMNNAIQSQIIDAPREERKEITDILLPLMSPKGHGRNKPKLLMYDDRLKLFDYISSFPKLASSTLNYIETINHLFLRQLIALDKNISDIKICIDQKTSLSVQQLFTFE